MAAELHLCGWLDNPSPQNVLLATQRHQWVVSEQGGHSAQGDWFPKFAKGQHVNYGSGSYGYGCACLKAVVHDEQKHIIKISSTQAKSLAYCRRDRVLKNKEPVIPK
jgi:hypothetical protein